MVVIMSKYKLNYPSGIKHITFIDKIKLLFVKSMYLYNKEFNFKIKYKIHKGKVYILKEIWGGNNE